MTHCSLISREIDHERLCLVLGDPADLGATAQQRRLIQNSDRLAPNWTLKLLPRTGFRLCRRRS
jgi:hypothetical protein